MASMLDASIQNLKYFGPIAVKKLEKLNIKTVKDLLYHFPNRYEDFRELTPISLVKPNTRITIQGTILSVKNINIFRKRMVLTEAIVGNDKEAIKAIWFNQPYLANQIKAGKLINLSGKVVSSKNRFYISNPMYEIINYGENKKNKDELLHTGRIIPIYPETLGFTSRWFRLGIKPILKLANLVPDILPAEIKKKYNLFDTSYAMRQIHFPENLEKANLSRRRFAFEELFILQLFMGTERSKLAKKNAYPIIFNEELTRKFISGLPFKLTDDQRKATWQIIQDIQKNTPMNRLLEGDVGSGKTIVAVIAAYLAVLNGYQVAFMAPTEILSRQHFEKISPIFKNFSEFREKVNMGILTSKESRTTSGVIKKSEFLKKVATGEIRVVIGTHSLIQKNVTFKNLALVIIDEQHRFGVNQRASLLEYKKGALMPHLLSMSATPIPRTLGLTVWGDLDLSLIKEMPRGRKSIITNIVLPPKRAASYEFIKAEIKKGRQAFVICPLIEESEKIDVKAAIKEYERLKTEVFPELKIGLLHGRLSSQEKEKIMADFLNNNVDILVATSVIEVGIDVPNATVMMIEGAERFGLASLYQFRGRVGRSEHQSYCFLLTSSSSAKINERLKAIESAKNGFELAEKDLEMRGPGDFIGSRQSGLPDLVVASLTDVKLIEETRESAKKLLYEDIELKQYPLLAQRLNEFRNKVHFE